MGVVDSFRPWIVVSAVEHTAQSKGIEGQPVARLAEAAQDLQRGIMEPRAQEQFLANASDAREVLLVGHVLRCQAWLRAELEVEQAFHVAHEGERRLARSQLEDAAIVERLAQELR